MRLIRTSSSSQERLRLEGGVLLLTRLVWLALVTLQLISFVSLLPYYLPLADHPCMQECALTLQEADSLSRAGLSVRVYLVILLVVAMLNLLLAASIGGMLFMRRSQDGMVLIAAYVVIIIPTTSLLNFAPVELGSKQAIAFTVPLPIELALEMLQACTIYGLFLLFPSGRFVPRWSWILLVGFAVFTEVFTASPELADSLVVGWLLFFGSVGACIVYRYRHVSSALERQQTKWVMYGFIAFLAMSQAYWLPAFTPLGTTVYAPLAYLLYQVCLPVLPITFFIAIQRYRLYDIDAIIHRTLVYGLLTAIVAVVYVAGVVGSQAVVGAVTHASGHAQSSVSIAVTTLMIVAFFQRLRRRLQEFVDRRFFRRKYDAKQTLADFDTTLRQEVNLEHLRKHLVTVVRETMQPEHISLWLRQPERQREGGSGTGGAV